MTENKIILKKIISLASPIIFSNIINATSGLIGMLLIAKINADALASGAIITSTYGLVIMMAFSIFYSISILIGYNKGAGQDSEISKIFGSGITLSFLIGLPLTGLFFCLGPLLAFLHQPPIVTQMTAEYFHGLAYGLIPSLIVAVFVQFFMGIAKTNIILKFTIIGVLLNSFASYCLIFGTNSIQPMGIFGAGLATSITGFIQLGLILFYIFSKPELNQYKILSLKILNFTYAKNLLKIGVPISIQYTAEILAFSSITYFMGIVGIEALAAQQVTLQCTMLAIMAVMGLSQAGSILISHNMCDPKLDKGIICKLTIGIGLIFTQIIALVYWFFSDSLIALYVDMNNQSSLEIISIAKSLLMVAAFTQIFDAGRNIAAGLLRGYGDTKTSMWTGFISCWIIGLPLSLIFAFILNLGAMGLRLGMMVGILFGCIQLITRLIKMNKPLESTKIIATGV